MAAPTVTWYSITDNAGIPTKGAAITVLDYGNVQAGYWSAVKAVVATFTVNSANTLKFWLNDTESTGGNTNVSSTANWTHFYHVNNTWTNPAAIASDTIKAGSADIDVATTGMPGTNKRFAALGEVEPSVSNFENPTIVAGADTDYIYMCVRPPSNAGDGLTENWGYRCSFLYP
jgi:hypothetical protein